MSKTLRVLIDARPLVDARGGGVRNVAEQVVKSIFESKADAEYYFVTTGIKKPSLPSWIFEHPRTNHLHLSWPNKLWSLAAMLGAVSLNGEAAKQLSVEENRPRKFDKTLVLNLGFTGFLETPYALLLHDLSFRINPEWFSFKSRIWHLAVNPKELIERAQRLFAVSETTARDAARLYGCNQEKIGIVKPGIRPQTTGDGSTTHALHPTSYILALGYGDPRKNIPTAINAFEILKQNPAFESFRLILVGSSSPRQSSVVRRPDIEVRSSVSDAELDDLYANASLFLYPSWYEGYGLPPHEAAKFGTPCIASTDGALPETAPEGTIFVPPSKPHLWAKAMQNVLTSPPETSQPVFVSEEESPDFRTIIQWLEQ